jgi:hypothetical protein
LEIYYISKVSWWGESSKTFILGLSAAAATFYFDDQTNTGWFIAGGVGLSTLDAPFESNISSSNGFGLFGGGGYEFAAHWSIEMDLLYSRIDESGADLDSFGVLISANFLAF